MIKHTMCDNDKLYKVVLFTVVIIAISKNSYSPFTCFELQLIYINRTSTK